MNVNDSIIIGLAIFFIILILLFKGGTGEYVRKKKEENEISNVTGLSKPEVREVIKEVAKEVDINEWSDKIRKLHKELVRVKKELADKFDGLLGFQKLDSHLSATALTDSNQINNFDNKLDDISSVTKSSNLLLNDCAVLLNDFVKFSDELLELLIGLRVFVSVNGSKADITEFNNLFNDLFINMGLRDELNLIKGLIKVTPLKYLVKNWSSSNDLLKALKTEGVKFIPDWGIGDLFDADKRVLPGVVEFISGKSFKYYSNKNVGFSNGYLDKIVDLIAQLRVDLLPANFVNAGDYESKIVNVWEEIRVRCFHYMIYLITNKRIIEYALDVEKLVFKPLNNITNFFDNVRKHSSFKPDFTVNYSAFDDFNELTTIASGYNHLLKNLNISNNKLIKRIDTVMSNESNQISDIYNELLNYKRQDWDEIKKFIGKCSKDGLNSKVIAKVFIALIKYKDLLSENDSYLWRLLKVKSMLPSKFRNSYYQTLLIKINVNNPQDTVLLELNNFNNVTETWKLSDYLNPTVNFKKIDDAIIINDAFVNPLKRNHINKIKKLKIILGVNTFNAVKSALTNELRIKSAITLLGFLLMIYTCKFAIEELRQ